MYSKIWITVTGIPLKAYDYVANGKPASMKEPEMPNKANALGRQSAARSSLCSLSPVLCAVSFPFAMTLK